MDKAPKLKDMKKEEIPGYIWDYYKIHIIVGLVVLIFLISFIHGRVTAKESVLNVATANCYSLELRDSAALFTEFMEQEGFDEKTQEVTLNTSLSYSKDGTDAYAMSTLMTVLGSNTVDVLILDENLFYELGKYASFMPLDECFSEDDIAGFGDNVMECEYEILDSAGEVTGTDTYAAGIRLKGNRWIEESGLYPGYDPIVCVMYTEKPRYDVAADFVRFLLSY